MGVPSDHLKINFIQIKMIDEKIRESDGVAEDFMCLSQYTSKWKLYLYAAVNKEINGIENIKLSGKYYCKVYEGAYRNSGKWMQDYNDAAISKGMKIHNIYQWYTTCPKCAKKYGKNYVVFIGQIE